MDIDLPTGMCGRLSATAARWRVRLWVVVGVGLLSVVASAVWTTNPADSSTGSGRWVWPLVPTPKVVRGFDPPEAPWLPGHRGVDLAARPGQAVRAAGSGQVTFAGLIAGVGVVVVDHGALRTTYQPVDPRVGIGKTVAAGQVIGRLAIAEGHCLPATCLHWGLLRGDTYLDPLLLVGGGRVRLLPMSGTELDPRPMLTDPIGARPTPWIQRPGLVSARWPRNASVVSVGEWPRQVSRPEPNAPDTSRHVPRSDASTGESWLWATGWLAGSAVGAALSLRFSARWAAAGRAR
jgi:hypothetical protein